MNKTTLGVALTIIAILLVGGVVLAGKNNDGNPVTTDKAATDKSSESAINDVMKQQQETTSDSNNLAAEAVATANVSIDNFSFSPETITVKKGTKVTWTNKDTVKHDVAPDSESEDFKASNLLDKDESYSFTFEKVGTYTYHCTPHPNMKATVVVTE
jgi:amicyanin